VSATSATLPQPLPTRFESDREWFNTRRNEVFRIREPRPNEFASNELTKPDRGAPVVFAVAVRDPTTGDVRRIVRMLRHRLLPNLRAVHRRRP